MRQNVRPIRIIHHVYNIRRLLECRPLHRFLLGTISFGLYVWQAMMQSSCDKERAEEEVAPNRFLARMGLRFGFFSDHRVRQRRPRLQ